jgi:hypothetical protein
MSKTKLSQALIAAEPSVDIRRPGSRGNQVWRCFGIKLFGQQSDPQTAENVVQLRQTAAAGAGAGAA